MNKIIVEVGSTVVKADIYDGKKIESLKGITIEFKKHYNKDKKLNKSDTKKLIDFINNLKNISNDIYICGTSIFRTLSSEERKEFLVLFKKETGYDFDIISQEKENELTVFGATKNLSDRVCVFIGGGGSTEISIFDKTIKESVNTKIGVVDIMDVFPDLAYNIATSDIESVKKYIKDRLNLPSMKADILILAGGAHKRFAIESGIKYEKNTLYDDPESEIMMDINTRIDETKRYYQKISLDEIRNRVDDPEWWYATRAMCAFVLVVAESIEAKYIIPTNISMVYGLLNSKS